MRHPEFPASATLATVLALVSVSALLRARNVALLIGLTCVSLVNFSYFVNTLVWAGNVRDAAPVWCDITTNLRSYGRLSLQCAALCCCKHLYWISSPSSVSAPNRPSRNLFEIILCGVLPLISIPIRYAVAPFRYIIIEDLGCVSSVYKSTFSFGLIVLPHFVICLAACSYACVTAYNLVCHRNRGSLRTRPSFLRLATFSLIISVWPPISFAFTFSRLDTSSWPGSDAVHAHFSHIPKIQATDVQSSDLHKLELAVFWFSVTNSVLCFLILASSYDTIQNVHALWKCLTRTGRRNRQRNALVASIPMSAWFDSDSDSISEETLHLSSVP